MFLVVILWLFVNMIVVGCCMIGCLVCWIRLICSVIVLS